MMHSTAVFIFGALLAVSLSASAVNVTISCGAVGQEREFCEQATSAWAKATGNQVTVLTPPNRTNERYFQYLVDLGAGDSRTDVYQIDVIWPGLLAKHLVDLKQYIPPEEIQRHFPTLVANNTVEGRLVGAPWFTDAGMLYYLSLIHISSVLKTISLTTTANGTACWPMASGGTPFGTR